MKKTLFIISMFFTVILAFGQDNYTPSQENIQARAAFQDDAYGMFIHWGIYSMMADGEWVMNVQKIPSKKYKTQLEAYHPSAFNAEQWVLTAKNAGMKYIVITSRHHDGFSNWDTAFSDWKITNTSFKRDVLKELALACKKHDIKLGFYYSLLDWTHEEYPWQSGRTGKSAGRTREGDYLKYLQFMKDQLTELLTNYGPVSSIWFDGHWDQTNPEGHEDRSSRIDWKYEELYQLIHQLQPACMVGNNHHLTPFAGEDFQMFERDLPGENKSGFNFQEVTDKLPLESCDTMNGSWGYNMNDNRYKDKKEVIQLLAGARGRNTNLLLNVGPTASGVIQEEFTSVLREVGTWLQQNGSAIYGTRGGPLSPQIWGVTTQNNTHVYVHVFTHPKDDFIFIPGKYQKTATLLVSRKRVPVRWEKEGVHIATGNLPKASEDLVIELTKK